RDEAAVRVDAVRLVADVLRRVAEGRQQRRLRLHAIAARDLRVGDRGLELRVVLLGAVEGVAQREDQRRARRRARGGPGRPTGGRGWTSASGGTLCASWPRAAELAIANTTAVSASARRANGRVAVTCRPPAP